VRGMRALGTRLLGAPKLRLLDRVFPPDAIDYESRPYHLGWVLDTWLAE